MSQTKQRKAKRPFNPLLRRVPKELIGDWHKNLVIFLFLSLTIGFISGMCVANHSMIKAVDAAKIDLNIEDGHFELDHKANRSLIRAIEKGEKVDLRSYYIKEAHKEIDEKVEEEVEKEARKVLEDTVRAQIPEAFYTDELFNEMVEEGLKSDEYKDALEDAIEDARKEAYKEADQEINEEFDSIERKKSALEKEQDENFYEVPVTVYEDFYKDVKEDSDNDGVKDGKVRIFSVHDEINMATLLEGRLPETDDEIAIDRMHADNKDLHVGDTIRVGGKEFEICGLIALINYSTLFENNTDLMFDAINFDVAWLTEEGYESVRGREHYSYAWKYENAPAEEAEEDEMSTYFLSALVTQSVKGENDLLDYVPAYANNAITFAPEDISDDKTMSEILLYILIVVLAFVFAITISSTINREASVIGTLRASGYTKGELVRHYMATPVLVTLLAAIAGNILGYTVLKNVAADLYYNSYSLPKYETIWNNDAFVMTTAVPVLLMIAINYVVVRYHLRLSPLKFLRHDLRTGKKRRAVRLPKIKFFGRFRLRVVLQNLPNYFMLLVGILFVAVMLAFAYALPSTVDHYQDTVTESLFANYQVVLKSNTDDDGHRIYTENEDAERYCTTSLQTIDGAHVGESISVYGVDRRSKYIHLGKVEKADGVYVSTAYAKKFKLKEGDVITLEEKYKKTQYTFTVEGVYDYTGALAIFMPTKTYNKTFDHPLNYFNGFLSDTEITDIPDKYVGVTITVDEMTKVTRQLEHSMGNMLGFFKYVCLALAMILIYLLTKVIVEKNENAISMVKILGYENREIVSLYLVSTTIAVIVAVIGGTFGSMLIIDAIWKLFMTTMSGWLPMYAGPKEYIMMILLMMVGYFLVMLLDYRRIKRIPMDQALKNVE